ncbi:MAG: RDD family protein [Sumerlaeia bacterium]
MAQIAPFLKPEKKNSSSKPPSPPVAPKGSVETEDSRPMVPLANYIRRLCALVLDILFLYFLARMLFWGFRDEVLANADLAQLVEKLAVAGYFVLGASSFSDGRTLGKLVMGIRVTDYQGKLLNIGQAFLRTVVLFPGMFFSLFVADLIFFNEDSFHQQYIYKQGITLGLNLSLFIATSFAISFNPFKQGLHDYLCKTVVRPVGAPMLSVDEIKGLIGGNVEQVQRQPQLMAGATFVLVFALILWQILTSQISPKQLAQFEFQKVALQRMNLEKASISAGFIPNSPFELTNPYTEKQVNEFIADIADEASTETVRLLIALRIRGKDTLEEPKEELLRSVAADFRNSVLRETPPSFNYGGAEIEIINFLQRPLIVNFLVFESYYYLNQIPADTGEPEVFTFDFPPISEKRLNMKEEEPKTDE